MPRIARRVPGRLSTHRRGRQRLTRRDGRARAHRVPGGPAPRIRGERRLRPGHERRRSASDTRRSCSRSTRTRASRPTCWSRLLEVFDEHPEVGICGCRLVREDGSFDHAASVPSRPSLASLGHFTGLGRRRSARLDSRPTGRRTWSEGLVDAVNGAFMLMRRAALDEVGLFDEGYWMYMEDLDLCYRFREAGWSTWYEPSVVASHVKGGIERAGPEPEAELRVPLRDVSLLPKALRTPVSGGPQRARLCRDLRQAARLVDEKRVAHLSPKRAATWLPTQRASLMTKQCSESKWCSA